MLLLMHLKHELVVMELPFANIRAQAIIELLHNEGLSAARVSPEVYTL
jgi:hypothetical protein